MKVDLGSWTTTKAAAAVAAALAIGGAIGSAIAITPTVSAPIKFQSGWEISRSNITSPSAIFNVPAGKSLMITDVVLSNFGSSLADFGLYTGDGPQGNPCQSASLFRLRYVAVPVGGSTVVNLTTGIGFTTGKTICVLTSVGEVQVNMRGYFFTVAPPA